MRVPDHPDSKMSQTSDHCEKRNNRKAFERAANIPVRPMRSNYLIGFGRSVLAGESAELFGRQCKLQRIQQFPLDGRLGYCFRRLNVLTRRSDGSSDKLSYFLNKRRPRVHEATVDQIWKIVPIGDKNIAVVDINQQIEDRLLL